MSDLPGTGFREDIDPDLVIPDKTLSLKDGAIKNPPEWDSKDVGGYSWQMLEALAETYQFSLETPFEQLDKAVQRAILHGTGTKEITVNYVGRNGRKGTFKTPFEGVIGNMQRRYQDTNSDWIRMKLGSYITRTPCPECGGKRLRKEALGGVLVDGKTSLKLPNIRLKIFWSGSNYSGLNRRRCANAIRRSVSGSCVRSMPG